jgi:predicted transcriptional regulator
MLLLLLFLAVPSNSLAISLISGGSGVLTTLIIIFFNKKKKNSEVKVNNLQSETSTIENMASVSKVERELREYFEVRYKELLGKYDELFDRINSKIDKEAYLIVVEERDFLLKAASEQRLQISKLEADVATLKGELKALTNELHSKS